MKVGDLVSFSSIGIRAKGFTPSLSHLADNAMGLIVRIGIKHLPKGIVEVRFSDGTKAQLSTAYLKKMNKKE